MVAIERSNKNADSENKEEEKKYIRAIESVQSNKVFGKKKPQVALKFENEVIIETHYYCGVFVCFFFFFFFSMGWHFSSTSSALCDCVCVYFLVTFCFC